MTLTFVQHPAVNDISIKNVECYKHFISDFAELLATTFEFVADPSNNCLGIAAPQVNNHLSWFVARNIISASPILVINPAIIGRIDFKKFVEGCFSVPGEQYRVKRAKQLTTQF